MIRKAVMLWSLAGLVGGCHALDPVPEGGGGEAGPAVFTAVRLVERARAGEAVAGYPARSWVTPRGEPLPLLSPPFRDTQGLQVDTADGLQVLPAFSEGAPAALNIVEVWDQVPEVWIQPWYVLVTQWDPANPYAKALPKAKALVDVGPESLFYSPYWELIYVEVPADTPPDRYTSADQLFHAGFKMHRGAGLFAPLTPPDLKQASTVEQPLPTHPFTGAPVTMAFPGKAWLKGQEVSYLYYGTDNFRWDEGGVVEEVPLFVFTRQQADGTSELLPLPAVLGTGPLGTVTPPRLSATGVPLFGGLTRLVHAQLPARASPLVPPELTALREALVARGVTVATVHPDVAAREDLRQYLLRVALNPKCFNDPALFPAACGWLDSQAALQGSLPSGSLAPQRLLLTSPLVHFNGKKVGP